MKQKELALTILVLLSITFFMAYDFFPKSKEFLYIPKPIVIGCLLLILFLGLFVTRLQSSKSNLYWHVTLTSYLLVLIIVFSLFGGASQVGISLSNPALWIVLVISFFEIVQAYKKFKSAPSTLESSSDS